MQEHHYEIELDATPEEVWEVFWYRGPDKPKPELVTIEILHPGDEIGEGLVRHCTFPVPKVLGSGGVGKSWEWVTQVKPYESWRYDAVGKPLWSRAVGHISLDDLGDGRTRVHFIETLRDASTRGCGGSGSRSGCTRRSRATTTRSSRRSTAASSSTGRGKRTPKADGRTPPPTDAGVARSDRRAGPGPA